AAFFSSPFFAAAASATDTRAESIQGPAAWGAAFAAASTAALAAGTCAGSLSAATTAASAAAAGLGSSARAREAVAAAAATRASAKTRDLRDACGEAMGGSEGPWIVRAADCRYGGERAPTGARSAS